MQKFSYIYFKSLAGDGSITVRVVGISATSATSGIFIRESVAQNSKYFAAWVKPNQGTVRSYRASTGGSSNDYTQTPVTYWLRIERVGNVFRSYTSTDGIEWVQFGGDQTISMSTKVLVGLMVATGNTITTNLSTFDNLSFTGGVNVSTPLNALPAPTNLSVSNVTSTSATLSWAAPDVTVPGDFNLDGMVDGSDYVLWRMNGGPQSEYELWRAHYGRTPPVISGYTIERSLNNIDFVSIGATSAYELTFTDTTLSGAETYFYRVRTNDGLGSSVPSSVATAAARAQVVTGLKVYSTSTTQLVVEWLDVSGEINYTLQRSTTGTGNWTTIGATTINRNTTLYVDNNRTAGTQYFYRVITVDSGGNSATSDVVSAYTRSSLKPTNFTFNSTNSTSIAFSWDAIPNVVRYAVYRGRDNSINEWQLLSSNVTTPTYTNTGLTSGREYYYRIVGFDANGVPTQTSTILGWPGLTTPTLPSPWLTQDIGAVGISGAAGYSNGTFTIIGGGADIWGSSDQFRYVYTQMTGNGFIQAYVSDARDPTANFYSRAGLQIRETLNTNSKQVSIMLHETDGGTRLQARTNTGNNTGETLGPIVTSPYWLRLERSGNTITGKVSPDGVTWTTVGSYNVTNLAATVYIGMAMTPRDNNWAHWAKFENVSSTPTGLVGGAGGGAALLTDVPPPVATPNVSHATHGQHVHTHSHTHAHSQTDNSHAECLCSQEVNGDAEDSHHCSEDHEPTDDAFAQLDYQFQAEYNGHNVADSNAYGGKDSVRVSNQVAQLQVAGTARTGSSIDESKLKSRFTSGAKEVRFGLPSARLERQVIDAAIIALTASRSGWRQVRRELQETTTTVSDREGISDDGCAVGQLRFVKLNNRMNDAVLPRPLRM